MLTQMQGLPHIGVGPVRCEHGAIAHDVAKDARLRSVIDRKRDGLLVGKEKHRVALSLCHGDRLVSWQL